MRTDKLFGFFIYISYQSTDAIALLALNQLVQTCESYERVACWSFIVAQQELKAELPREERSVLHRRLVQSRHIPVCWQILIQKWQHRRSTWGMSPVAHEIHDHAEHAHQDHSRSFHTAVGIVGNPSGERAAGVCVGKDGVTGLTEGEREV